MDIGQRVTKSVTPDSKGLADWRFSTLVRVERFVAAIAALFAVGIRVLRYGSREVSR